MKCTIDRASLNTELRNCAPLTTGGTLPVLQMVRLEATEAGVILQASNLETGYIGTLNAQVKEPGAVCVSAARLRKLAAEMEGEVLTVEADEKNVVKLTGGACVVKLYGLPGDDFPPVEPPADGDSVVTLLTAEAFKLVDFASTDETRFILNGVFVQATPETLTLVATDGRRLGLIERQNPQPVTASAIIPSAAARMFAAIGAGYLRIGPRSACFSAEGRTVSTKLIEGTYPNYRQVIPPANGKASVVTGDLAELRAAVHRVALVSGDSIGLASVKGKLTVSGGSADVGSGAETVDAAVKGPDFDVAVSPAYLLSALAHLPEGGRLEIVDSLSPIVARGGEFTGVVMPMRKGG